MTHGAGTVNVGYNFIFRDFEKVHYNTRCMIGTEKMKEIQIFSLNFRCKLV